MKMIQFSSKAKIFLSSMLLLLTLALAQSDIPIEFQSTTCGGSGYIMNSSASQNNLKVVLSSLVDNVNKTGFYISSYGENGDKIYGLAQCRGDLNASTCGECVSNVTKSSLSESCLNSSSITITTSECFLKYSTQNFNSNTSYDATFQTSSCDNSTINGTVGNASLSSLLTRLTRSTVSSNAGYSTLSDYGVYSLAQCWRDISINQCNQCLNDLYNRLELTCPSGSSKGFATTDGCMIQFTTHNKFYGDGVPLLSPTAGSAPSLQPSSGPSLLSPTAGSAPSLQPSNDSSKAIQGKNRPHLFLMLKSTVAVIVIVVVLPGLLIF